MSIPKEPLRGDRLLRYVRLGVDGLAAGPLTETSLLRHQFAQRNGIVYTSVFAEEPK